MLEWYWFTLVMGTVVAIDLVVRWNAFGQVESVALDIALFSAVYSAIEFVSELAEADAASPGAGYKLLAGVLVLIVLAGWHRWLKDETRMLVRHVITQAIVCIESQPNQGRGQKRSAPSRLRSLEEVAEHVVLVALSAPKIREGKKRRRDELAEYINLVHGHADCTISGEAFLLPLGVRRRALLGFAFLSAISFLIALLRVGV